MAPMNSPVIMGRSLREKPGVRTWNPETVFPGARQAFCLADDHGQCFSLLCLPFLICEIED